MQQDRPFSRSRTALAQCRVEEEGRHHIVLWAWMDCSRSAPRLAPDAARVWVSMVIEEGNTCTWSALPRAYRGRNNSRGIRRSHGRWSGEGRSHVLSTRCRGQGASPQGEPPSAASGNVEWRTREALVWDSPCSRSMCEAFEREPQSEDPWAGAARPGTD